MCHLALFVCSRKSLAYESHDSCQYVREVVREDLGGSRASGNGVHMKGWRR